MDATANSISVPQATAVEGISDKMYKDPERQKQSKKKKKEEKQHLLNKPDEVLVEGLQDSKTPANKNEHLPLEPGDKIDITV